LTLTLGGLAVFALASSWWVKAPGMLLSVLGSLGISTQAHTASHGTVSGRPWVNRFLTYLGYPVLLGLSASYWRYKHIVIHHKAPNVDGHDDDIRLLPLFALTQEQVARGGPLARFYHRYVQWLVVVPAIALNGINTQAWGWAFLLGKLASKESRTKSHWLDLGALALHLLLWLAVPMLWYPAGLVLLTYVLRMALVGYGMFAIFAPAHFPAEAAIADISQRTVDYVLRQTATTVNFRTGPIGRLLCAGVEYQIEHHLFPNFSHVYYPAMSPLVRAFCQRHGYPYRTLGWGEGIFKSLLAFACPRPLVKQLQQCQA
jgi:fatty acid desaturase